MCGLPPLFSWLPIMKSPLLAPTMRLLTTTFVRGQKALEVMPTPLLGPGRTLLYSYMQLDYFFVVFMYVCLCLCLLVGSKVRSGVTVSTLLFFCKMSCVTHVLTCLYHLCCWIMSLCFMSLVIFAFVYTLRIFFWQIVKNHGQCVNAYLCSISLECTCDSPSCLHGAMYTKICMVLFVCIPKLMTVAMLGLSHPRIVTA